MFPEDFDGIVVGAPAVNFNNLTSWRASFFDKTGASTSPNFISASAWQGLIHDEVLKQCDTIDGVADGIIEDPTLCNFRPEALICSAGQNSTECLTEAQVEIVKSVFSPLYGSSGELVFPAMQPGSEVQAVQKLYSGTPFPYSLVCSHLGPGTELKYDRIGSDMLSTTLQASMTPISAPQISQQHRL